MQVEEESVETMWTGLEFSIEEALKEEVTKREKAEATVKD